MRPVFAALVSGIVLPFAAFADDKKAEPNASSFVGTWDTTFGRMSLREKDGKVSGIYLDLGTNLISGTVKDRTFTFTYTEGKVTGEGEFVLADDGESFTGKWRVAGATDWKKWVGKRAAAVKKTFTGQWATTFGSMVLTEKDGKASGKYGLFNEIAGTVDGDKLTFTYTEGRVTGEGEFELGADGLTFAGKWREAGQTGWEKWTGKRVKDADPKPDLKADLKANPPKGDPKPDPQPDLFTSRALTAEETNTLDTLLTGTEVEQTVAAAKLADGKATPALVSSLCRRAMDEGSRTAALDALGVINPQLSGPVAKLTSKKNPADIPIGERFGALSQLDKLAASTAAPALPVVMAVTDKTIEQFVNAEDDGLKKGSERDRGTVALVYITTYRCALGQVALSGEWDSRAMAFLIRHGNLYLKDGKPTLDAQIEQELFASGISAPIQAPHHGGAIFGIGVVAHLRPSARKEAVKALIDLLESKAPARQAMAAEMLPFCGIEAKDALAALEAVARDLKAAQDAITEIKGRVAADKKANGGAKLEDVLALLKNDRDTPAWRHGVDLILTKHPRLLEPFRLLFFDGVWGLSDDTVEKLMKATEAAVKKAAKDPPGNSTHDYYAARITLASEAKVKPEELTALLRAKKDQCEAAAKAKDQTDPKPTKWTRLDGDLDSIRLDDGRRGFRGKLDGEVDYKKLVNALQLSLIALDKNGKEKNELVAGRVETFRKYIKDCGKEDFDPDIPDALIGQGDPPLKKLLTQLTENNGKNTEDVLDALLKEICGKEGVLDTQARLSAVDQKVHVWTGSIGVLRAFAKSDPTFATKMAKTVAERVDAIWKKVSQNDTDIVRKQLVELMTLCGGEDCLAVLRKFEAKSFADSDNMQSLLKGAIRTLEKK